MNFIVVLILFLILPIIFIGFCVLEFFLAKNDNKWIGFILPIASFILSILLFILLPLISNTVLSINAGKKISFMSFLLCNGFNVFYLLIYFFVRLSKKSKVKTIDNKGELEGINRMKIEDLD